MTWTRARKLLDVFPAD